MGRQPCCEKVGLRRGPWTIDEDNKLMTFILNNGIHCWRTVPKLAGLLRCGKSCRLRWINYLRPDLKRGDFTEAEENQIIQLHSRLGNRWSKIASHFPGRTDNEIKNHWNTRLKKKLRSLGVDPLTHKPFLQERATSNYNTPVLEANNNPQEIYDSLESKASTEETQEDVKLMIQNQGKEDDGSSNKFETKCQVHLTTNNNYNMLYGNGNISSSLISEVGLCQDTNNDNSTMMMCQSYCFPANEMNMNSCYSGSVTEFRPINEDTNSSDCSLQQHWAAAVVDGNLNPMLSCDYWLQDDFFNF